MISLQKSVLVIFVALSLLLVLLLSGVANAQIIDGGLCSDIIARGGDPGNSTVCRVFPNPNLQDVCNASCAAAGGTCFRQGFCCPDSWELCGLGFATISACFDPARVTCCGLVSSPGGTAPVLCDLVTPNRAFACATVFQPACITTNVSLIPPPQPNANVCGNQQVFDPARYVCLGGTILCPREAFLICNNDCFDPTRYACSHGTNFTIEGEPRQFSQLCPIEAPDLCGTQCYSRSRYICYSSAVVGISQNFLCPLEAPLLCGANQCFSASNARCENGTVIPI